MLYVNRPINISVQVRRLRLNIFSVILRAILDFKLSGLSLGDHHLKFDFLLKDDVVLENIITLALLLNIADELQSSCCSASFT